MVMLSCEVQVYAVIYRRIDPIIIPLIALDLQHSIFLALILSKYIHVKSVLHACFYSH